MQNLHMQRNCRRFSAQVGQQMNCTQKIQRVRCCGRVLNEQEIGNELSENSQGRGQGMRHKQGRGQGRGQGMANNQAGGQGRGQRMANNQGNGRGCGQGMAKAQGRGQGMISNQA